MIDLPGAIDEAEAERLNAGAKWSAAILNRRRRPTGDAYVVLPLHRFAEILTELGGCCRNTP